MKVQNHKISKTKGNCRKSIIILIFVLVIIVIGVVVINAVNNKNNLVSKNNLNNEFKLVSKYNTNIEDYQDVNVKLNRIQYGEEASKALEEYNITSSHPIEINLKDDEELMAVEYEIDFLDFDMGDAGVMNNINVSIVENEEKNYIMHNNKIYVPTVKYMNNYEFKKDKIQTGRFVMTIPKDNRNFKLMLGVYDKNFAYFDID